jgi:hypothetical protein
MRWRIKIFNAHHKFSCDFHGFDLEDKDVADALED